MPSLEVQGVGKFDVQKGKRLVLAVEEDAGVDILHRCGGHAKCTTCRIEYLEGEPSMMTKAEKEVLESRNISGARLSCQTVCNSEVSIRVLMTMSSTGLEEAGPKPKETITPRPEWVKRVRAEVAESAES